MRGGKRLDQGPTMPTYGRRRRPRPAPEPADAAPQVAAEGTTYRRVLDETRLGLAAELLARPGLATEEVAARLGFASLRLFNRAFVRWTGRTPRGGRAR